MLEEIDLHQLIQFKSLSIRIELNDGTHRLFESYRGSKGTIEIKVVD